MNEMQPLTADEMLEHIFKCMSKLATEKDFYKSIILLTDLGKTLTNAHRASFWYRDEKKQQYWTLAASGTERITIPMGTGIVGASIENKETILINNPYEDPRFNSDVDKQTGYVTKAILCMPVTDSNGDVIGAYQVINKMGVDENCAFRKKDIKSLSMAAAYGGKILEAQLLREQKLIDQLTGLKNRRGFYNSYEEKIIGKTVEDKSSIIICDIDFFKKVNDTYGHNVGDEVLVYVSEILKNSVEGIGEVFRWGGEEFIILLPDCDLVKAMDVSEGIRLKVQEGECVSKEAVVKVTMSFGVIEIDLTKDSADNIKNADDNLYRAKKEGRNRVIGGLLSTKLGMDKISIVPDIQNIEHIVELSKEYSLGFEYDDFFIPSILDNEEELDKRINSYLEVDLPDKCTLHGAFFDVIPFSADEQIKKISLHRIEQSIDIARRLGAKAVVFHTNYNPFLNSAAYVEQWINTNIEIWGNILKDNSDMSIYIENMFDRTPDIMVKLSESLCKYENYGICLDYAHAALSEVAPEKWAKALSPYIKHVHINDNDLVSDLHLAWGDGKIDRHSFYRCYKKYMNEATILIETSSLENINRSLNVLKADGFC